METIGTQRLGRGAYLGGKIQQIRLDGKKMVFPIVLALEEPLMRNGPTTPPNVHIHQKDMFFKGGLLFETQQPMSLWFFNLMRRFKSMFFQKQLK